MNNAYLVTRGLVLRERGLKEADKILTVLTDNMGKQTMLAAGCKRKGSRIKASSQILTLSEFTVFRYKDWLHINEAQPMELFMELRCDLDKLSLASYFCELLEAQTDEDTPNAEILPLALNTLYALSKLDRPLKLIKAAFELKLMCLSGYAPMLEGCSACGGEAEFFDLREGVLYCANCRKGGAAPVSAGTLAALRHIALGDPKKLFSFSLSEPSLSELGRITEEYQRLQLERGFDILDFYKKLQKE